MNNLSFKKNTFDTVIFCASLHHSSDILQSLKIANSLKKGGSLIIHGSIMTQYFLRLKKGKIFDSNTILDF